MGSFVVPGAEADDEQQHQEKDGCGDEGYVQEIQMGSVLVHIDGEQHEDEEIRGHIASFRSQVDRVYIKRPPGT